ncbi:hypothetical protein ES703_84528 [subsurface metagenome]
MPGSLNHRLNPSLTSPLHQLPDNKQFLNLCSVSSVSQTTGTHPITKAQGDIKLPGHLEQAVIVLIEGIFTFVVEHPADENRPTARYDISHPPLLPELGNCLLGNTTMHGYEINTIVNMLFNPAK